MDLGPPQVTEGHSGIDQIAGNSFRDGGLSLATMAETVGCSSHVIRGTSLNGTPFVSLITP